VATEITAITKHAAEKINNSVKRRPGVAKSPAILSQNEILFIIHSFLYLSISTSSYWLHL
jgi:hypothetical protein